MLSKLQLWYWWLSIPYLSLSCFPMMSVIMLGFFTPFHSTWHLKCTLQTHSFHSLLLVHFPVTMSIFPHVWPMPYCLDSLCLYYQRSPSQLHRWVPQCILVWRRVLYWNQSMDNPTVISTITRPWQSLDEQDWMTLRLGQKAMTSDEKDHQCHK